MKRSLTKFLAPQKAWMLLGVILLAALSSGETAARKPLFPASEALQPRIDFWIQIYSRYTRQQAIFHDAEDPHVVYQVVNLEGRQDPVEIERFLEPIRERYVDVLKKVAAGAAVIPGEKPDRIRALFGPDASAERLVRAAENVRFQRGQADAFIAGLVRRSVYEEHLRRIFKAEGLPYDLTYLPHVESSFQLDALSRSGAAGIWQFTRPTGRQFLRVTQDVDQRWDPIESTRAAARLLKRNYRSLKTWPLAITAYNHGVYGMKRAVRRTGTARLERIIQVYKGRSFGFASKNFYAEFLAAREVAGNPERYFGNLPRWPTFQYEELLVDREVPLERLLSVVDLSVCDLAHYNPALLRPVLDGSRPVPRRTRLKLPAGIVPPGSTLASLIDDALASSPPGTASGVQAGAQAKSH